MSGPGGGQVGYAIQGAMSDGMATLARDHALTLLELSSAAVSAAAADNRGGGRQRVGEGGGTGALSPAAASRAASQIQF